MIYNNITIGGELYHHGVKGMKWGVRRYQPYISGYSAKNKGKYVGDKQSRSYTKEGYLPEQYYLNYKRRPYSYLMESPRPPLVRSNKEKISKEERKAARKRINSGESYDAYQEALLKKRGHIYNDSTAFNNFFNKKYNITDDYFEEHYYDEFRDKIDWDKERKEFLKSEEYKKYKEKYKEDHKKIIENFEKTKKQYLRDIDDSRLTVGETMAMNFSLISVAALATTAVAGIAIMHELNKVRK